MLVGVSAASAQQPSNDAAILAAIDNDDVPVPALNLMVDQVEDMDVIGSDGGEIGEVEDVLGDANGQPKAISVEVGGFLGMGEKKVILMLDDVKLDLGKLRTALTKQQIQELPDFAN
jgi:hypothetical protein